MKSTFLQGLVVSFALLFSTASHSGVILALDNDKNELVSFDTNTFTRTTIGALGVNVLFAGLAYDFFSDTLYMVGGRGNNNLYTVNRTTGAATLIGSHGISDLFGLAFDTSTGRLYGTQSSSSSGLFSLDINSGAATAINPGPGFAIGGLTYNHVTDQLVGVSNRFASAYSINKTTGLTSFLGGFAATNESGFTFDADNNRYWSINYNGDLFSYDIDNNYALTNHAQGLGNFDGAVYLNKLAKVPEPTVLFIFAIALLSLVAMRKRKHW